MKLLLLMVICLGICCTNVLAQDELRQADRNKLVLELPTINFTRLYNEVPLINLSRLYSRLFNATKEKTVEINDNIEETQSQRQHMSSQVVATKGYYGSNLASIDTSMQRSGGEIINVQVPNGQNGLNGGSYGYGLGYGQGHDHVYGYGQGDDHGYGYGQGHGHGHGHSHGYSLPNYAQIYGSNNYNNIPGVQVLQQPYSSYASLGSGLPNYLATYANLNNDRTQQGYLAQGYSLSNSEFNHGHGQYNSAFAPFYQWLQSSRQGLNYAQSYDDAESVDYNEEDDNGYDDVNSYDRDDEYGYGDEDDFVNGELDDYDNVNEDDYGDDLWRKAEPDSKIKTKTKPLKPSRRLKSNQKNAQKNQKQKASEQRSKRISY